MKKIIGIISVIAISLAVTACNKLEFIKLKETGVSEQEETTSNQGEEIEETSYGENAIIVFADDSLSYALDDIKAQYETGNSDISINLVLDSSKNLLDKILAGEKCDIFISGTPKDMDRLDYTKDVDSNPNKNDYILNDTRANLVENRIVLVVPNDNPKEINSFSDLTTDKLSHLAIVGNDVQLGISSREMLEYLGKPVSEFEKEGKIISVPDISGVIQQIEEGKVDAGVISDSEALISDVLAVDIADSKMCSQIIYPVAVLKTSKNAEEAKKLLKYFTTEDAMRIFNLYGFIRTN